MKKYILPVLVSLASLAILSRLAYLQIIVGDSAGAIEGDIAIEGIYDYPLRGNIFDRNGVILVSNQPSYDVMVVAREVKKIDTLEFCSLLGISKDVFVEKMKYAKSNFPRKASVFVSQLSKDDYAPLQEKLYKYRGFYIQKRSLRNYETRFGANYLGYISEVNETELKQNPHYLPGELIGRSGVERQYDSILRGVKGVRYYQKDKFNRVIGSYKNGIYDTLPVEGKSLKLTIDSELQNYGEILMRNKRGGIVAIEPQTGEILALVSSPSYDPNLLVGRERSRNYTNLYNDDIAKPLFNRALLAEYPPGSTFKPFTALIALEEGVATPHSLLGCAGGYRYGSRFMKCHSHASPVDMVHALATSCNAYFAHFYKKTIDNAKTPSQGIDKWANHLHSFGFGKFLGSDFPTGRRGYVPTSSLYNRQYGENRWSGSFNISNGIGQGELLVTPIQLANAFAAIANRGYYYTPHIVKEIDGKTTPFKEFTTPKYTTIKKENFEPVIQGMYGSYTSGTSRSVQIDSIKMASKTGTAENYIKIEGKRMKLTDHSIFAAFAPLDNPKIAIVVFVENGSFGARIAAPITSLMIEKYLRGCVNREDMERRMLDKSLQQEYDMPYKHLKKEQDKNKEQ